MKKFAVISSFDTCVPKIIIIWCTVPETQSETDMIFCHFGPFFALQPLDNLENQNFKIEKNTWRYYHFTHMHHKWQSYDYGSWERECNGHNFLSFWTIFYLLPPYGPRKSKFWKNEKNTWRYMCMINDNHMMYGSWVMEHNRHNFLSF